MDLKKIAIIVGSLRKESWSRKLAKALITMAPATLHMEIIEIGQLPHYNQDEDDQPPSSWSTFRQQMRAMNAVLFITPEYNRSFPGVLKNALDVGSRPYGHSIWSGKPGAIISISIGAIGGFGANHHLRQTFTFLDIPCMQQPEAYIGNIASLFDENGQLNNENTKEFLIKFIMAFADWVSIHSKKQD